MNPAFHLLKLSRNVGLAILLIIVAMILAGCSNNSAKTTIQISLTPTKIVTTLPKVTQTPAVTAESTPTATVTSTPECELIWPKLHTLEPAQVAPSTEVKVIGDGGYLYCNGGYNESARNFELLFDGQPIGTIGCYVNRCEATISIPADSKPGEHRFSVEGGASITIEIVEK